MSRSVCLLLAACWVLARLAAPASAAPARPVVAGFERFFADDKADAIRGGRLLLTELACVQCHQGGDDLTLPGKQGPVLDNVAERIRVGWLRRFLMDPHGVKPGTTMPDLLASDPNKADRVEALVHFLASTGSLRQERPQLRTVSAGRDLYHKVGCVACHGTRKANGEEDRVLATSVPLGDLKAKYSHASLAHFLAEPHRVRPSGRMPRLLDGKEATAVANYLLQGLASDFTAGRGATRFSYYEGSWDKLPDFTKRKPQLTGTAPGFDIGVARRGSNFALKFQGVFAAPRAGTYTFTVSSDDGAQLFLNGKLIVDNDGVHATRAVTGRAPLTEGTHSVVVTFFQGGGEAVLDVTVEGPGLSRRNLGDVIAVDAAALKKAPVKKPGQNEDLTPRPELLRKGKDLFAALGCASCHTLHTAGKPIASTRTAPPRNRLRPDQGCLSGKPAKETPWYPLDATQRRALGQALPAKAPAPTPARKITETMTALNCYACHSRDKVGGPQDEINSLFTTVQPEMGDEGRLPPPLDGVGAKLTPEYLRQLLDRGGHDRPYMHTRMPGFGDGNAGHLVPAFAASDRLPVIPEVKFKEVSTVVKSRARFLVGDGAFACIKCHTFAGKKAEGVQGIDMTLMPKRLRRDWFHAYITDPQKVRPGTRMPSAFTDGKSVLPKVFDGTALTQIEAMWLYLQDGTRARVPTGMGGRSIPLVPTTSAILYRNFLEGVGSRGIAVGYPEKAHLAFDANELRIVLLWQGAFLDAGKHWTDRGAGFEGPLGDNIVRLHGGIPFALLPKADAPWPAQSAKALGYRFRGYRLTPDDRPTFLYAFNDVEIEDFPNPVVRGSDVGMKRILRLRAARPVGNLTYRAAAGSKIEEQAGGWYRVDGSYRIQFHAGKPQLRRQDGKAELLVPVSLDGGKGEIVVEYAW